MTGSAGASRSLRIVGVGAGLSVALLGSQLAPANAVTQKEPASAPVVSTALKAATSSTAAKKVAAVKPYRPSSKNSGLRWASGVFLRDDHAAAHAKFAHWRGFKTDVALVYGARDNWAKLIDPQWLYQDWKPKKQKLVISQAPFPDATKTTKYTLKSCAAGKYDSYWEQFGVNVANAGMQNRVIVRLAWEFNGTWTPWAAYSPTNFVGCWKHIYKAAEKAAPGLRWDWTVNRGYSGALKDPTKAWPGKKYVDIVGIDSYDGYPPVKNLASWNTHLNEPYGLNYWANFAKRKGKGFSLPEWGLYSGTDWKGHSGGDNPYYIKKMYGFFRSLGTRLAYEAYFNDDSKQQAGAFSLNPKGGKEYKKQLKLSKKKKK